MRLFLTILGILFFLASCRQEDTLIADSGRPQRQLKNYFDKKYMLYQLPDDYYNNSKLSQSFEESTANSLVDFKPLGHDAKLYLQYTHVYSQKCVYNTPDYAWKFAEVCFPNTCLTNDNAYALAIVRNNTSSDKNYYLRLFYQNTSYWYPTGDSIDFSTKNFLTNYYGASQVVSVRVEANNYKAVKIPYTIGLNPKHEFDHDPSQDPARPGNYEFLLIILPDTCNTLMNRNLNLRKVNPFAEVKKDEIQNGGRKYFNHSSYVSPQHFKFVFLDEYFDGTNDLTPGNVYVVKDSRQKRLCDTCNNWYRAVISEHWSVNTFSEGFISKARFVKADYGIKKENTIIDSTGITITIPRSRRGLYNKNWGEFNFGPSFKYGHLTVRAKFAQMFTNWGTPNGIIHNLWLYQRDLELVDTTNPYHHFVNSKGRQPFEIDFEFWSSMDNINTMWDDNAFINYAIVDYMRNASVSVKPGEQKELGNYKAHRLNNWQLNIPGQNLPRSFFESFHTYELYWEPERVRFLVDGQETAFITSDAAKIPDRHMYLWIGSPLYQDGTYYQQSAIPFLKYDKKTVVDYIRIE